MRRMQGLDMALYQAETPTMHLHVVGALVLDPGSSKERWGYDTMIELLDKRLHMLPPFRWRPVNVPGDLDQPRWIEDPDFDLEAHVLRAELPRPADMEALARFVGELASSPLDRSRPLWEMHVVEEMDDGSVAVVTKLHHSFMDGGAGSEVMASIFDLDPEGDEIAPATEPWVPEPVPSPWRLLTESVGGAMERTLRLPGMAMDAGRSVLDSVQAIRNRRASFGPPLAPSTPFNGSLGSQRSVAFARGSLDSVKAVKEAFGVTVNDVILAGTTSALRTELLDRDALPDRALIAMCPVSERQSGEIDFSNRISTLPVPLPVHLGDPLERLEALHDFTLDAKDLHRAMGPGVLQQWAGVVPPVLLRAGSRAYTASGLARFLPPVFNLIVSNVPGPPVPLYLAGARVTHLFPLGPLFEGSGLNITLMSHDDVIDIGLITCASMLEDPEVLGQHLVDGIEELAALVG